MKNVKNVLFFLLATAAAVAVLGGCDTSGITFTNERLLADGDGHFEKDLEYTEFDSILLEDNLEIKHKKVWTYGADGSCSYKEYFYEEQGADLDENGTTGEGYLPGIGTKGTYTYNNETYTLTETTSEVLSWDTGYQWADDIKTITSKVILFENLRRKVFSLEDGILKSMSTETDSDSTDERSVKETIELSDDNKTLKITWIDEKGDDTKTKREWIYKSNDILPSKKTFSNMEAGDVITFKSNEETTYLYGWDSYNVVYRQKSNIKKYGKFDQSFIKVDEYFIFSPVELDRDLR